MNKCSTCRGYNTIVDVDGEEKAYDCPMCAGSGLASDEADTLAWYDSGCPADSERSILTDLIEGVRDFADDSVWEDNPDIGLLELADRAEARLKGLDDE